MIYLRAMINLRPKSSKEKTAVATKGGQAPAAPTSMTSLWGTSMDGQYSFVSPIPMRANSLGKDLAS
jgi:hypothetical protein